MREKSASKIFNKSRVTFGPSLDKFPDFGIAPKKLYFNLCTYINLSLTSIKNSENFRRKI